MGVQDIWRAPARAGRRLFRIDLVLIPLALMLFLGGWELLVRWQDYAPFILPGPGLVWARFLALARDGSLAQHTATTVAEVLAGLTLGLLILPLIIINAREAIRAVPHSLREAGYGLGATKWQTYWRITFPLLRPTVLLVSITSMLQCLRTFSVQYLFTLGGAPLAAINVITLNIYFTGIRYYRIGRASAMSIILLVVMVVLTWAQFRTSRTDEVSY